MAEGLCYPRGKTRPYGCGINFFNKACDFLHNSSLTNGFLGRNRQTGPYATWYWMLILCNVVLPQLLWLPKVRSKALALWLLSIVVNGGMWLERFLIVVPSLAHKYLPYAWGSYRPTWVEITITVGTFAGMALLYLLFSKAVPIISIWELKLGGHKEREPAAPLAASNEPVKES